MHSEEQTQEGIYSNGIKITNIRYADDTIIIAETERACKIFGRELKAKETRVMVNERKAGTKIQTTSERVVLEQV